MKGQRTEIWKKEEYSYEGAHGFIPVMVSYMHEDDKIHPAMIVVPGGRFHGQKHIWLPWIFTRQIIMYLCLSIQ